MTWQLQDKYETELLAGHLFLKCDTVLDWTQTWTAHFSGGAFLHTEAISDSVRLAEAGAGQFFTSGSDQSRKNRVHPRPSASRSNKEHSG